MQLGVFIESIAGFLDLACSPDSELAENARKATVKFEQECSMLKSSRKVRFLSALDSDMDCGLEMESTAPWGRPACLKEISAEWRMRDLCFIEFLLDHSNWDQAD
jgi:hypothetical protein